MKWAGLGEFLAMGGYGLYVWGSYAMTAAAIIVEIAVLVARHKAARRAPQDA